MQCDVYDFHQIHHIDDAIVVDVAVLKDEHRHLLLYDDVNRGHHIHDVYNAVIVDIAHQTTAGGGGDFHLFWHVLAGDVQVAGVVGDVFQCNVAMGVILVVHSDESEFVITEHTHGGWVETCTVG